MTDSAFCRRHGMTAPTVQAPDRPRHVEVKKQGWIPDGDGWRVRGGAT
jgi:hypothetical protein